MASKSDITFSLGVEIDKNAVNASMSETERLLSSYKAKLEKSILKDFNKTVGGVSTSRLFGGNKNAHIMSMRDELGSLFKGINRSNTFSQMEKTLNKVADVFAKFETGFKTGEAHIKSRNEWLSRYSGGNTSAFNKIYSTSVKEARAQAEAEKRKKISAIERRLAGYDRDLSRTHEFDDVINGFNNNDGGLNAFEDRNRAYLNLLKQRNDAKKRYDDSGDIDALKEYTSADQQLKALKDQEKEKKNNAKEEKGSLIRFGKMLVTLHLIKKVLNSIKDIWKRLSDTELKVTQRDVKEKGFFGVDAYSAMHANVDRSHAVISRGLGYMGAAAPFSMDAFDSVLKQLQDLNLKAISGQGIADEQLVISLQRLSDSLGMGFSIKDILTDPNLNLTDFLTNLMNSVEKFLPKLNSLDDIKKSLVTNDIIKALGPELANALVYNYNYNQRTGGTSTVMEQVTSKGTNAYGLIDYTQEAKKFTDALASSRAALDDFKVALAGFFAPTGKKIANQVNEKIAEGTMIINALKSKSSGISYTLVHSGAAEKFSADREELSEWYKVQANQEKAAKKLEDAKDFNSLDDVLNYAYYNPTALAAGTSSVGLEKTIGLWKGAQLATRINGKKFSELNEKDFTPEEWAAINDVYYGHRRKGSSWTYEGNGKDIFESKSWKKLFGEGGAWDLMYGVSPTTYAKNMIGQEAYEALLIKLLSEDKNLLHESGIMKEGGFGYYTKDEYDAQGNKISGTVVLRLELSDGTYRDIPTIIEDGMMKAIANTPTIQVAQ
jgi:hypothetical protein